MKRWWVGLGCVLTVALVWGAPSAAAAGGQANGIPLRPLTHTHPLLGTDSQSTNWSGYDVTGGPFTSVTATWTQPRVRPSGSRFSDVAFWVGLDGDTSGTVEQIGTEGFSEGVVGYDAWYEMYPNPPVTIGMSIHPGDVLTGTVAWSSPAQFTLALVNHTTGMSFTTTQTMTSPPALASAEVIAEAPSSDNGVVPLADFTLCTFTACAFDGQPISAFDWTRIDMVSETGVMKDQTLTLGSDGASFAVTTDVTAPTTMVRGDVAGWHRMPVALTFVASDIGTGVASTEYSLDGGTTWTQGDGVTIPAPADHSGDGVNRVLYRSTDNVGNVEKSHLVRVRIDTQRPTPFALRPATVTSDHVAILRYRVDDPRPGSPTATVTILVRNHRGVVVKRAVLRGRAVDTALAYRFLCRLPRGRYSYSVAATDAAGNRQTSISSNSLVVH
jgi:Peptidase A4 family